MNKNLLYLTFKLAALAAVTARNISANTVVTALAFCCLFVTDFIIDKLFRVRKTRSKRFSVCAALLGTAGCFLCGGGYFPLLIMLFFELIDRFDAGEYFYGIAAACSVLAMLILQPDGYALAVSLPLTAAGVFARAAVERVEYFRELSEKQRRTISEQNDRINRLRAWSHTLREAAALEERKRFSTRIHDKLGHGISGSIILLEGAKLNLKKDPGQAERTLGIALENLRGSVDSIRGALREERPERAEVSDAELKETLGRFSAEHGIKTLFSVEGDREKISPQIRSCIGENLTEALTNTLKHSNANEFQLKIRVYDKMIRVEFSDNGTNSSGAPNGEPSGMGLDGIEDRTAMCGGKCLFRRGAAGFKIINIFGVDNDKDLDSR